MAEPTEKELAKLSRKLTVAMIDTLDWIHESGEGNPPPFATKGILEALVGFDLVVIIGEGPERRFHLTDLGCKVGLPGTDDFYPEHGKLSEHEKEIDAIRKFFRWSESSQDLVLSEYQGNHLIQITDQKFEETLSRHFGISEVRLEEERKKMLSAYKEI